MRFRRADARASLDGVQCRLSFPARPRSRRGNRAGRVPEPAPEYGGDRIALARASLAAARGRAARHRRGAPADAAAGGGARKRSRAFGRPEAGRSHAGRAVAETSGIAAGDAAHDRDFAVPGRPGPGGDRRSDGDPGWHGEESLAKVAGAASREAGAPRRGRTLMDWLEQELKNALARKEPSAGFDASVRRRLAPVASRAAQRWLAAAAALVVFAGGGALYRR